MRRRLALAALGLTITAAASAQAATPVTIGDGRSAHVTLDAAGTAYVAWNGAAGDPTPLRFCRLARGASGCEVTAALDADGQSLTRPFVLVDGQTVRIVSHRFGISEATPSQGVYLYTSFDGGTTWGPGSFVGTVAFFDAIRGPGPGVSLIADNSSHYQWVTPDGPQDRVAELAPAHPYSPTVALVSPTTMLAVMTDGAGQAVWRFHPGGSDSLDETTWSAPQAVAGIARYPRLAYGPRGTFLASDDAANTIEVRRFLGPSTGFGAPADLPGPAGEASGGAYDMTQDPLGRLHVIWPQRDAAGVHVGYATSDDGTTWQAALFDVADPADLERVPYAMRLAVGGDHLGFAVWDGGGKVQALPVGPEAAAMRPAPVAPPHPATPAQTPAPGPPAPLLGERATIATVSGTVRYRPRGARSYLPLTASTAVPVGSTIDTRRGRVRLTSAVDRAGATQTADFYEGLFVFRQRNAVGAVTDAVLSGGSFARCPKRRARRATASKARTVRRLWGSGRGRFRTRGRHASATVRGTRWLTEDRCDGSWVRVREGTVTVRAHRSGQRTRLRSGREHHVPVRG